MSNLSNQTLTLSNTAEIVENDNRFKLSPLRWSKFNPTFVLRYNKWKIIKKSRTWFGSL